MDRELIKKALEHCGEKVTCKGCPEYNNEPVIDWFECKKNLLQKTITLINELESENKELRIANKLYAVELGKKDKKEYENLITNIRLETLKDFGEKNIESLKEAEKG